ncbi:MAG: hypothetical protein GVY19_03135 [Bacteroidetes bacterium]|jgi:tetratricopeptide (TPR) repeat protein|nr:hypothetical protein [Bacteroidota bacterium]
MQYLNNSKPKNGWMFRIYKINIAISQYLTGKISGRHNQEMWTYFSKNPEMFDELVIRVKMEKALRAGKIDEIMENWDNFIEIMNKNNDQTKFDEQVDEHLLGASKVFRDISNKLQDFKVKTGSDKFPWAGYVDPEIPTLQESYKNQLNIIKEKTNTQKILSFYRKYAAAAIILFVLCMGTTLYFFFPRPDNDQIYNQYYKEYPFRAKSANYEFSDFIVHYQDKQYTKSRQALNEVNISRPYYQMVKDFYMGISFLGSRDFNEAVRYLQYVIDSPYDSGFKDHALWYQGLAFLKMDEEEEAAICFRILKQREIPNKTQVKKVMRKIR